MSLNQFQNKEDSDLISSEYDRYRSEAIDKIDDLLLTNQITEMDSKMHKNCLAILKIMKNIQNKLYNNYEIKKEEIENFIYCLKFVDTLNIFMNNSMIDSMLKHTEEITNLVHSNNEIKNKDDLLHKIKYAEKSIVYFKKKTFKNLYFSDSAYLSKEIEKSLNSISQSYEYSNNFDRKIFKQMQNIFWVLQKKLTEEQKKFLQSLIDDLKGINIKSRPKRYDSYYDYNDSQNYYSSSNYYNNNYYGYSNYNNPNQNRKSDYYDPLYKKTDLVELPHIVQNTQKQEESFSQTNPTAIQDNYNHDISNFQNLNEGKESNALNNENENYLYQNSKQDYEKHSSRLDKNDFTKEKPKTNKDYNRTNDKSDTYQKSKRNRLDSKTEDINSNSKTIKESAEIISTNPVNHEKVNKHFYKVVEVDFYDSKSKQKELNEPKNIQIHSKIYSDQKEILSTTDNSYNKNNIETVIISSPEPRDLNNPNKQFNSYSNTINPKNIKKHKDNNNFNHQASVKTEKPENKNTSKKTKKNKSQHLLVEVDYSKSEKSHSESNIEHINDINSKLPQETEDRYGSNSGTVNKESHLASEPEDLTRSSNRINKDNIEIIRHYQSDYEYTCDYDTGKYGKYNSKYQKHYPNYYSKQTSSSKTNKNNSNVKEVESHESITDSKKSSTVADQKLNNDDLIVSNFNTDNVTEDKDNNSNSNNKIPNNSINNKYRNKSYSNYNTYNYGGYNNYKYNSSNVQEKVFSDKELIFTSEAEKKNKYIIKEVEFSDNKAAIKESIEMKINNFINDDKDKSEVLISTNPEAFAFEDQLVKSHSNLETNLNDLKFMDLKVNFEDFSKNPIYEEKNPVNNQAEEAEFKIDSSEQNNHTPVAYETIKTYINSHPRYNSGGSYKTMVKNKIGKYAKYHETNSSGANNSEILNNEEGSNFYKNPYYNNKQTFNQIKDHTNNFLNKNFNNNTLQTNNNYYLNTNASENFYEKSNYNTGKKKNYSNNYKPEKNFDSNTNIYNEDESFTQRKITEYSSKDQLNKDETNIENQSQNKDRLKYDKEYEALNENNDVNDNKKENLNNEFFNNNNFYSNKGHSNIFNSLNNNNIDLKDNVHSKNYQENSSKVYKDYNNATNANNFNLTNKNNSYLKNEKGNNMTGFVNENENFSNLHQDQNRNNDDNKSKNKKHNTYEYDYYDASKGFKNNRINQNNPNYLLNQLKETDDYVTKIRGREDYYDYANKLKNKKVKNTKSNNVNIKSNNNIPQNDNNYINYDQFNNPTMMNPNFNQIKFPNNNNMNFGLNPNMHNVSNLHNLSNIQNANIRKPVIPYKYNSTEIGLFNNLLGFNNKTNNNFANISPNNMINSNMNMFNIGMLNYIHQMNMFNNMNSINNPNNRLNQSQNAQTENKVDNKSLLVETNHKLSDDNKNEEIDIKTVKVFEDLEKIKKNEILSNEFFEISDPIRDPAQVKIESVESKNISNNDFSNKIENDMITDLNEIISQKEIKPISIFNMDIEKFFQSEARDINLQNISQLEKRQEELINQNANSTQLKAENVQLLDNPASLTNEQVIEKIQNTKEKYEFTSENETEKENLNENSSEQNESDEEPSSETSESIPNEEIEAAFENFQKEIRQMHSIPIPVEVDDDYYIAESDYIDVNKEKVTKNNKAIFEEGDSKEEIENDDNRKKVIDPLNNKKENINVKNLIDVDVNSNEEEHEEDELPSDNDVYLNSNISDTKGTATFEADKQNNERKTNENNKIEENNNIDLFNRDNAELDNKIKENPKSVVNNQIYNNFNFYNMHMIGNPNLIQYLNNMNNQKGKSINNNNNMNAYNLMDNAKLIKMNYGNKNLNNMGLNQNYNQNMFMANQIDSKNLREQTKAYTDSVKTIDPDLLKIIKNKLTENTNTKSHKNSINIAENSSAVEEENKEISGTHEEKDLKKPDRKEENKQRIIKDSTSNEELVFEENRRTSFDNNQNFNTEVETIPNSNQDIKNANIDMIHFANLLNDGKALNVSAMNKNMQFQNYLMSNWANFIFRGRDSNIHREYLTLKFLEQENPMLISKNIEGFEDRILIPVYQKTIFNVNKRKGVYFFTFNRYRKLICKVLQNSKILKKVKPYGSLMNNFMIDSGDIDICIVPNCGILEFAMYLDKIKEELLSQKIAEHKLTHHTSRYMLLKVQDNQTKFVIDITVHNMLPILNTKLIRMYSIYDQRFHILGLYLKHWSKINKIHGAADNYLSSYALLVMLIHFLQSIVEPKVLPNLQKIEEKEINYEYNQNGETIKTNIYFEEDVNKIKQNLLKINQNRENLDSASSLLIKFFEYYSYNYDYYEQKISISKEKSECFKTKNDNIAFSMEDPFDNFHNPGKSMSVNSTQFNKFVTAMKKEINFILNGEYLKRLDKVTSMNNPNQMAINMQLQMQMKNLQMLNNNQNNNNGCIQNIHS